MVLQGRGALQYLRNFFNFSYIEFQSELTKSFLNKKTGKVITISDEEFDYTQDDDFVFRQGVLHFIEKRPLFT